MFSAVVRRMTTISRQRDFHVRRDGSEKSIDSDDLNTVDSAP